MWNKSAMTGCCLAFCITKPFNWFLWKEYTLFRSRIVKFFYTRWKLYRASQKNIQNNSNINIVIVIFLNLWYQYVVWKFRQVYDFLSYKSVTIRKIYVGISGGVLYSFYVTNTSFLFFPIDILLYIVFYL